MEENNRNVLSTLGISRTSIMLFIAAGLLMYYGKDAAQVLVASVGHDWRDIVVTKVVRLSYVISGLFILAMGLKPFYRMIDKLTIYNTDVLVERLGHTGPAIIVAAAIGSYMLGGCIFLGMVFQP